jgi:hypothetical protein
VRAAPALLPLLLLAACSSLRVSSDFEGGSVGRWEAERPDFLRCAVAGQADKDGRNRQASWYYFRVDGADLGRLEIRMEDLVGEYDYKPGSVCLRGDTPPLISYDQRTWTHLKEVRFDDAAKTMTLTVEPRASRFWIAHIEPYTVSRLDVLLDRVRAHPDVKLEAIGRTVEGRELRLVTVSARNLPEATKPVIWLMARQHAWESGTSFVAEGALLYLLSEEGADLRERAVWKILPMMDPDGVARGGVRFNRNGYDVNRNWDTCDPEDPVSARRMPEIAAAKRRLRTERVDFFLTLHNQETGGWLSGSAAQPAAATRFFGLLQKGTSCWLPDDGPRPPAAAPPAPGRFTVYQWLTHERKAPAFLLEQGVGPDAKLRRLPVSADRIAFGRELARAMGTVVLER